MTEPSQRERKSFDWSKWIALYCAASFALLGVDAAMNHYEAIYENPLSYTPLIFAPIAVLACLVMVFSPGWRVPLAWVFGLLGVAVGIAGTIFHNLENLEDATVATFWPDLLDAHFPVFAPSSFAATGVLLLLIGIAAWWTRPRS